MAMNLSYSSMMPLYGAPQPRLLGAAEDDKQYQEFAKAMDEGPGVGALAFVLLGGLALVGLGIYAAGRAVAKEDAEARERFENAPTIAMNGSRSRPRRRRR